VMRNSVLALIATAVLLPGCDSPADIDAEVYALATVSGHALPAQHPDMTSLEIVSGTLTLKPGNTVEQSLAVRCRPDLSPGQCTVTGTPIVQEGTYSRAEGWIRFGDRQYPAEFASGSVTANYVLPPSQGFGGAVFVFTR
jgi:hypothetical protein